MVRDISSLNRSLSGAGRGASVSPREAAEHPAPEVRQRFEIRPAADLTKRMKASEQRRRQNAGR